MRSAWLGLVLASLAFSVGCTIGSGGSGGPTVVLASIAVSGPNPNIIVNQTEQLTATGTYSDHSSKDLTGSVTWTSSDMSLATVAPGGMLSAKSSGTVTITATMNSVSGTFQLTIAPALVSIAVTPANPTIAKQTNQQFIATGTFTDNSKQNITSTVDWSSSNTAAATISDTSPTKGLAQGVAAGKTTITATSGSISANASLTVTAATATSLAITPTNSTLPLDTSHQFTATATFSDSSTQDVTDVTNWNSSATSIATVTVSGLVTAKNIGSTTISGSFESVNDSTTLTVDSSNLSSISIQPANGSIAAGTKIQFTATGNFNDGSTHNLTSRVTWTSSNPAQVSINAVGLVTGISQSNVTITATLGGVTASVPFTVTNATVVSITVTPAAQTVPIGWHLQYTATGVFSDSSTQDVTLSVHWASDKTSVATIGAGTGLANAVATGTANINATLGSVTGTTSLTVSSATLKSISMSPSSALLAPGATVQINAKGTWTDGSSQLINQSVTWSSSNNNVATVSATGIATGQSSGTAKVTAQSGALSAMTSIVVEGSSLVSIQITPSNSKVPETIEIQLKATGNFADGQSLDLTPAVTWTSGTSSVATISNAPATVGIATGVSPGNSTISATFAGQSGTTTLTVTNATLQSIDVTPASSNISVGTSQQYTATGNFSDGSSINVTIQAIWSSSDVSVATINSSGVASAASAGTSTIKASLDGVNGTAVLTVH